MSRLKKMDKVAYVRFASVYSDFKDVREFMTELKSLLRERSRRKSRPSSSTTCGQPDRCGKFP
jgi:transcriptional repressor NrdR